MRGALFRAFLHKKKKNPAIDFVVVKTVPRQVTHTTMNIVLFLEEL